MPPSSSSRWSIFDTWVCLTLQPLCWINLISVIDFAVQTAVASGHKTHHGQFKMRGVTSFTLERHKCLSKANVAGPVNKFK